MPQPLKKAHCPRCGQTFEFAGVAQHKYFPFCSRRCREIDLGNWLTGKYVIPGEKISDVDATGDSSDPDGT